MNNTKGNGSLEPLAILDSKHILATNNLKLYNIKLVKCGDYIQVYVYERKKSKKAKLDKDLNLVKLDLDNNDLTKDNEISLSNTIEKRSIIRSKLECQRIAKSNINDWETFITLTFDPKIVKSDMRDISNANKRFKYFIDKVRRVKKDFKYICVPEFHKSGIVHYHLLCNIKASNTKLMFIQEDNKKYKHIKYWQEGFTSVEVLKGDVKKIIGYIAKYMTKDIDNRLFNRHRYFYSRNLITPKISYIDKDNLKELDFYKKIIQDANLVYNDNYKNPYDNTEVIFLEYLKNL